MRNVCWASEASVRFPLTKVSYLCPAHPPYPTSRPIRMRAWMPMGWSDPSACHPRKMKLKTPGWTQPRKQTDLPDLILRAVWPAPFLSSSVISKVSDRAGLWPWKSIPVFVRHTVTVNFQDHTEASSIHTHPWVVLSTLSSPVGYCSHEER
jgi:hypothetical protein